MSHEFDIFWQLPGLLYVRPRDDNGEKSRCRSLGTRHTVDLDLLSFVTRGIFLRVCLHSKNASDSESDWSLHYSRVAGCDLPERLQLRVSVRSADPCVLSRITPGLTSFSSIKSSPLPFETHCSTSSYLPQ